MLEVMGRIIHFPIETPTPSKDKTYARLLWAVVALAAITRLALAFAAPRPFGYAWDLYHEGAVWTWLHGRLPLPTDCGECYHPPLLFVCEAPLYALGGLRLLSWVSTFCSGIVVYYCWKTLRLLRLGSGSVLLGTALAAVFPCLFIGSYGAENDVVLTALLSAFFYRLCVYHLRPAGRGLRETAVLGILAGLAALTKYSGLLAVLTAGVVLLPRMVFGRRRLRTTRDLAVIGLIATFVCGWHYAGNLRRYHKAFLGPPWDTGVFDLGATKFERNHSRYDFASFKIKEVVDLYRPENIGKLNDFPVYDSVFSSLHAQAWTDMSFFSIPSRHGWQLPLGYAQGSGPLAMITTTPANAPREAMYPPKRVSLGLIGLTLRLGLIPSLLALIGLAVSLRRRALWPFAAFAAVSSAVYTAWFLTQPSWALKTKYILFLLPVYAVYCALGLKAANRVDRRLGFVAAAGLIAALCVSELYLWSFALG